MTTVTSYTNDRSKHYSMWPYIAIDKAAVDQWANRMARCPNERQTLALEALLKTTIIHEGGHWHYALVSKANYLIFNDSS